MPGNAKPKKYLIKHMTDTVYRHQQK